MTTKAISVFIDGFYSLKSKQSAFRAWRKLEETPRKPLVNKRKGNEPLRKRWKSLKQQIDRLNSYSAVHILAYSMGTHLALKLIGKLQRTVIVKLLLIAPDPKFKSNGVDNGEDQALFEAKDLWRTDTPGEAFSKALIDVAERENCMINIVYSTNDPYAIWEDNVEKLKTRCLDKKSIRWACVEPQTAFGLRFNLASESIHQDLFLNCQNSS